jgi:hypothetical protein
MVFVHRDDGYNPTPDQNSEVVIVSDLSIAEHAPTEVGTNAQPHTSSLRLLRLLRGIQSTALLA